MHPLHEKITVIDGLQYSYWSRDVFEMMIRGGLSAVHVTIAYWENTLEALANIGEWTQRFQTYRDLIMPVNSGSDIYTAREQGKVGIIFGFQNCSPIANDYRLVEQFHTLGVRFMQLSYNNQSLLASGCYEENDSGISRFGKVVIQEMNRVGMIIDMSHSGERSTLEAIEISAKPITVSHANPTSFQPVVRNKSEAVLKAIAETNGMLGFSLYPLHLKNGSACTLTDFCEMVARTAELMGIDHIGIGSDLCVNQPDSVLGWMRNGRWNKVDREGETVPTWPSQPSWFQNSADFGNVTQGLLDIGFDESDVSKIMGGNWLRFFEESW